MVLKFLPKPEIKDSTKINLGVGKTVLMAFHLKLCLSNKKCHLVCRQSTILY